MKIFRIGPNSYPTKIIRGMSEDLAFLSGRTERLETLTVSIETRGVAVVVKVGEREKHTLTYHERDNSWTVSFVSRHPWEESAIKSFEAGPQARYDFVNGVLYSLRACRQIGGAPMITEKEEAFLKTRVQGR